MKGVRGCAWGKVWEPLIQYSMHYAHNYLRLNAEYKHCNRAIVQKFRKAKCCHRHTVGYKHCNRAIVKTV